MRRKDQWEILIRKEASCQKGPIRMHYDQKGMKGGGSNERREISKAREATEGCELRE